MMINNNQLQQQLQENEQQQLMTIYNPIYHLNIDEIDDLLIESLSELFSNVEDYEFKLIEYPSSTSITDCRFFDIHQGNLDDCGVVSSIWLLVKNRLLSNDTIVDFEDY